jgi:hypothetical protein
MKLTAEQRAELQRITEALASLGPCLPGSVVIRTGRCGKARCPCKADPPRLHGPYRSWTRKVDTKTVTRIFSPDQLADYQPLLDNERRLRALVADLHALGLQIVESDPRCGQR